MFGPKRRAEDSLPISLAPTGEYLSSINQRVEAATERPVAVKIPFFCSHLFSTTSCICGELPWFRRARETRLLKPVAVRLDGWKDGWMVNDTSLVVDGPELL